MNSYQKEAAVGLFVLLGIAAFVGGGMFLSNKSIKSPDVVVLFSNIGNLVGGTSTDAFTLSGTGTIASINGGADTATNNTLTNRNTANSAKQSSVPQT